MSIKSFRTKKFEDFEILDAAQKTLGHIRVKPNGILWAGKDAKVWRRLTLDEFATFAEENGERVTK